MDCGEAAKKNVDHDPQHVREPVYFSNDTILESAKFLNYQKWSQMRFLCRRVNQLIQSNQSKLQAFEVTSLRMSVFTRIFHKTIDISNICKSNSIVSFNQAIQSADAVRKWFQDRGYLCDETTDIPLEKVFTGMNLSSGNGLHFTIRAFFEDLTEKNMPLSEPPQVFSAKFNHMYDFYGPILSYFFRLLHHPTAYFREVLIFLPMTDKFCDMSSHSPIRCDLFTLKLLYSSLEHSLNWLKDNVRAQKIILSFNYDHAFPNPDLHSLLSEFLLQDASICAKDRIKLTDWLPHPGEFVKALIKKYETLEVTKPIPSIMIEKCKTTEIYEYLESNLVRQDDAVKNVVEKLLGKYDVKSYKLQNKMDGRRKMIAQVREERHCVGYIDSLYLRFE
ncbi:hypothetical protein DdX_15837 [Ditylenchus destructor]|uniref:Uncharacterized protein n=1 Tax=Ditylenchus destructor TaxID=166010 RepID=A0AAD4MRJ1_9BILA|nr:hypothetical protein DdX_15837 [Ditylenchus destructor]